MLVPVSVESRVRGNVSQPISRSHLKKKMYILYNLTVLFPRFLIFYLYYNNMSTAYKVKTLKYREHKFYIFLLYL